MIVMLSAAVAAVVWHLVWLIKTKGELTKLGADIPSSWLLVVPLMNFYFLYRYFTEIERLSRKAVKLKTLFVAFCILFGTMVILSPVALPGPSALVLGSQALNLASVIVLYLVLIVRARQAQAQLKQPKSSTQVSD